jgi:mono/diheme cytochrome c family protein
MRIAKGLLLGLSVAVMACGGSAETPDGEATSGGDVSKYEGAIASSDVAQGQEQFESFCGDCHPDGGEDVGPSLIDEPHTPARIRQQVREGSGKMRPMSSSRLGDDDLEAILAYMASLNAVK